MREGGRIPLLRQPSLACGELRLGKPASILHQIRLMGPTTSPTDSDQFTGWLAALQTRHLQSLTRSELTRALRALSSCYVERRDRLTSGGALDGAGKRAAFALFYAPLHFLTITRIVQALDVRSQRLESLLNLGCGTGAGGGAWALDAIARRS